MSKRTQPTVYYEHRVIEELIKYTKAEFPYEAGGFIFTHPYCVGAETWHIKGFFPLRPKKKDRESFSFSSTDYLAAVKYGADRGLLMAGAFHSHPWAEDTANITYQSHDDAQMQSAFDFPLSLVVGLSPSGWDIDTWRNHQAAPLMQKIVRQERGYTLAEWLRLKGYRRNKIWNENIYSPDLKK